MFISNCTVEPSILICPTVTIAPSTYYYYAKCDHSCHTDSPYPFREMIAQNYGKNFSQKNNFSIKVGGGSVVKYLFPFSLLRERKIRKMPTVMSLLAKALPKAELHLHIEGTLEPELMVKLAERNHVKIPYASVEEVRAAYKFTNLQSFLDIYYAGASVLIKKEDFKDLAYDYVKRAHSEGLHHVELFFDPQTHTARNIPFATVIEGLEEGLELAKKEFGVTYILIMSFLRHLSEEDGFATLQAAMPYLKKIAGVGLDSSEVGHPPEKFSRLYAKCRELGLKVVAHAGEEGPAAYMWGALNDLKVCRIDHGVRCETDPQLVEHLIRIKMPLTVCPLSNTGLKVFPHMKDHNIIRLLRKGVMVTSNSDDPAYFGGYIGANFAALEACDAKPEDLVQLAKNSFLASWLPEAQVQAKLQEIDAVYRQIVARSSQE